MASPAWRMNSRKLLDNKAGWVHCFRVGNIDRRPVRGACWPVIMALGEVQQISSSRFVVLTTTKSRQQVDSCRDRETTKKSVKNGFCFLMRKPTVCHIRPML